MFKNKVEVVDNYHVLTNPNNLLVVNLQILQQGQSYYTFRTIQNLLRYAIFKTFSFIKWGKIGYGADYRNRWIPARIRVEPPEFRPGDT